MKGYMIFSGGGVLGSALAGAWKATDGYVEPLGFGGTSVGAILACLGVIGVEPREVGGIVRDKDFRELLTRHEHGILESRQIIRAAYNDFRSDHLGRKYCALRTHGKQLRAILNRLSNYRGLDDATQIRQWLWGYVKERLDLPDTKNDITFGELAAMGRPTLRIVASDATTRRAKRFCSEDAAYSGESVLSAVIASMSYPLAFMPITKDQSQWVDGGLCSNTPSFLFEDKLRNQKIPSFVFQLQSVEDRPAAVSPDLLGFIRRLVSTAIEGSDAMIADWLEQKDLHQVTISVPSGIDAMQFDLDQQQRTMLFDRGVAAFDAYYKAKLAKRVSGKNEDENEIKQRARVAVRGLEDNAIIDRESSTVAAIRSALRFEEESMQGILKMIREWVERNTNAESVRVHLMFPTLDNTRIVVYQTGMDAHPDLTLEIGQFAGCSGTALQEWCPILADLEDSRQNPGKWRLSASQANRVPEDRSSMMSYPLLFTPDEGPPEALNDLNGDEAEVERRASDIIAGGTISIDTSTELADTGWGEQVGEGFVPNTAVADFFLYWGPTIARLLT